MGPGHSTAPRCSLTSTRACRRRCVRGPKGQPSSGCSCWASDFFSRASTSGRKREGEKNNPKHAEVSSGAGQPLPQGRGAGAQLCGAWVLAAPPGACSPSGPLTLCRGGWGQRYLWCPTRSAAPGRLSSCQQQQLHGLHPSVPPAGPPGPSAGSNASPVAGSVGAGLSTVPGAPRLASHLPPGATASSPGRNAHREVRKGTEPLRAGRDRGERVGDGARGAPGGVQSFSPCNAQPHPLAA